MLIPLLTGGRSDGKEALLKFLLFVILMVKLINSDPHLSGKLDAKQLKRFIAFATSKNPP